MSLDPVRLRAIEKTLAHALAVVREALDAAENERRPDRAETVRYVITWWHVPTGKPRRGLLHTEDCWMAKGDRLTIGEVARERQRPNRIIEACDVCEPGR